MVQVVVRSVVALSADQLAKIKQAASKKYGSDLEVTTIIDPSLVGGVQVTIGSRQLDGSLKSKFEQSSIKTSGERNVGEVISFGDGVIRATGLDQAQMGELIDLGEGQVGLMLNLEKNSVGIVALGRTEHLRAGSQISTTGQILSINVNDEIIGRVVDPTGQPLDGRPALAPGKLMRLERIAPGVMTRKSVSVPLQTGIKSIDAMIPIGRGQRELIIGDRGTGKTAIGLGAILNQADQNVICVYVSIGQKRSSLAQTRQILESRGAMAYTTIVSASASEPASLQFLAPYAGIAIAEYFLDQGKDVLIVYDDLTKHAQAYREISLLLRRPSGREAYPGDVFYLHSRLLERAARLNEKHGGGSITALPVIETQGNDISAFIPTNVISITDGQLYLETDLFNAGMKPAINVGSSVSRVGSAAQIKAMKQVAGTMKLDLAQFRELQAFSQFSSDLDDKTKAQLDRGIRVNAVLKQGWDTPLKIEEQVVVIFAAVNGFLDQVKEPMITQWEKAYLEYIHDLHDGLLKEIRTEQKMSDKVMEQLKAAIAAFNRIHEEWMMEG